MASLLGMPKFRWSLALVAVPAVAIASFSVPAYDQPAKAARSARHVAAETKAVDQARSTGKQVEVVVDRTASSSTFAEPTGQFITTMTPAPTRVRQKDGSWASIDETLHATGHQLAPKFSPADVAISSGGSGDVVHLNMTGDTSVGLTWPSALPTPTVDRATATYSVSDTASLQATAQTGGFSARVVLAQPPMSAPTYRFGLDLQGLTASLRDGVLRFTDAAAHIVAVSRPLAMWDARKDASGDPARKVPVEARLVSTPAGAQELDLTPSMAYLTDRMTRYPVTIDPDVIAARNGDTYFYTNNKSPEYQDYRLVVGTPNSGSTVYRSYLNFKTDGFAGHYVSSAHLSVLEYTAGSCDPRVTNAYPVTKEVTNSTVVWATQPPITTSPTWSASTSANTGKGGCPNEPDDFISIDVTKMVHGWASPNGDLAPHGIELRAGSESDSSYEKRFCSMNPDSTLTYCNTSDDEPVLSVTWQDGCTASVHCYAVATWPSPQRAIAVYTSLWTSCLTGPPDTQGFIDEELWVGTGDSSNTKSWVEEGFSYGEISDKPPGEPAGPFWFWAEGRPLGGYDEHYSDRADLYTAYDTEVDNIDADEWGIYRNGTAVALVTGQPSFSRWMSTGIESTTTDLAALGESNALSWIDTNAVAHGGWQSGSSHADTSTVGPEWVTWIASPPDYRSVEYQSENADGTTCEAATMPSAHVRARSTAAERASSLRALRRAAARTNDETTLTVVPDQAMRDISARAKALANANGFHGDLLGTVVRTTRTSAARQMSGILLADHRDVYLVEMNGHFTGRMAHVRPGTPLPRGTHLTMVMDAASGTILDWGIGDRRINITQLGKTRAFTTKG